MKVSLKKEIKGIPVKEMKDGDLAVITSWKNSSNYKGSIVQRYKDCVLTIGKDHGQSWEHVFDGSRNWNNCYVRLLEDGDELVIRK